MDCEVVLYTISGNERLGIRTQKVTNFMDLLPQKFQVKSSKQGSDETGEVLNDGER